MRLPHYLQHSRVSDSFRAAVEDFLRTGRANERIAFDRQSPAVKVERTLTKVLVEYPELEIESIEIRAHSGCEYYRGELTLRTADAARVVAFNWDCRWRAEENGWHDYFGFPDQARAAREYDWDCFRQWAPAAAPALATDELSVALV
jgi:hypothetical protein